MAFRQRFAILALLIAVLLIGAACTDFAKFSFESADVHITVVDASGNPMPGSEVTLSGPKSYTGIANHNGVVSFTDVEAGSYTMSAVAPNEYRGRKSVVIWGGDDFRDTLSVEAAIDFGTSKPTTVWEHSQGFSITVNSGDIWDNSDSFHFRWERVPADTDVWVQVQVVGLWNNVDWTKAGLMLRNSLTNNSRHASLLFTGHDFIQTVWRNNNGSSSNSHYNDAERWGAPIWLAIERTGNTVITYYSFDGEVWHEHHRLNNFNFNGDLYAGIAISAHTSTSNDVTGVFNDFRVIY